MRITHRLIDEQEKLLGYLARGKFISEDNTIQNIKNIRNVEYSEEDGLVFSTEIKEKALSSYNEQCYNKIAKEYDLLRDIQEDFKTWKNNHNDKVLKLIGPRYTGKTVELLKFAYKNYKYITYFNLLSSADYLFLYDLIQYKDTSILVKEIQDYCDEVDKIGFRNDENTILIIDDIQEGVEIYNHLKILKDNLSCHIAVVSEQLKMALSNRYNTNIDFYTVKSSILSFKEFCTELKLEKELLSISNGSFDIEAITKAYEVYKQIGGYPIVVKIYKNTKDIKMCKEFIHHVIYYTMNYMGDSIEYVKERFVLWKVTDFAAKRIGTYDNIFTKESLKDVYKLDAQSSIKITKEELNRAIAWLVYTGIIKTVNVSDSDVALYFADCGIASYLFEENDIRFNNNRLLTEMFLINELDISRIEYAKKRDCKMYFSNNNKEYMISNIDYENYEAEVESIADKSKSNHMIYDIQYTT